MLKKPLLLACLTALPLSVIAGCGDDSAAIAPSGSGVGTEPAQEPGPEEPGNNSSGNNGGASKDAGAVGPKKDSGTNTPPVVVDSGKPDTSTPPPIPPTDPDDPALDDPARPSLPYECPGTPMTAAEAIEHIPQGDSSTLLANGKNWNNSRSVVRVYRVERKCHPATGCAPWQADTTTSINRHDYPFVLYVSHSGVLQLVEGLFNAPTPIKTIATGDFQATFLAVPGEADARRYKTRITRLASGAGCFSAASTVSKNPPAPDGSTFEWFFWGKAEFSPRQTIPRVVQPARTAWASHCSPNDPLATNAIIATWFPPGGTTKNFPTAGTPGNSRRESSQQCHPITGCTPWKDTFAPSDEMYGLQVTPSGFAVRFDGNVSIPIVNGKISGTHPQLGLVEGVVTSTKCVSYDAKSVTQYSYVGPSIAVEQHLEERNSF
jgi:hypothetical protein